jgi:quinol monooxygenase YgiN
VAYVVIARWTAEPGEEQEVERAIRALIEPSRAEPGMLLYQAHRDPEDRRVFCFYEQYLDEAAYRAHGDSEHFRKLGHEDALPRLESRERSFYVTIDD